MRRDTADRIVLKLGGKVDASTFERILDGMWRSLSNPRVLLLSIFAAGLFWSVMWAYAERPRLLVGVGGIGDTVVIRQSEFDNAIVRSAEFRDALERRMKSAEFDEALRSKDSREPPLFRKGMPIVVRRLSTPGLDTSIAEISGMVFEVYENQALVFLVGDSGSSDLYVLYLVPQSYRVHQPANSWIRWLQARLPGVPDASRLAVEAETANDAVKNDVRMLVQRTIQDCVLSRH